MSAVEKWLAQPDSLEQLKEHAPEGFSVDRAKRSVLALLQADAIQGGKLSQCSPRSLVLACVQAAALGLELGTDDAYVIPYYNRETKKHEAQLAVGYQGLIKLAKRSGEILHLKAEVVYEGEPFVVHSSSDRSRFGYDHSISIPRSNKPIVAAYVRIDRRDGLVDYELLDADEIAKVRKASQSKMGGKTSPAWSEWEGEMAKKAVIRRALKRYNLTPEIERIFVMEDAVLYEQNNGSSLQASDLSRRLGLVTDPPQLEAEEPAPSRSPEEPPASESAPPQADNPPADAGASEGKQELVQEPAQASSLMGSIAQLIRHAEGVTDEEREAARKYVATLDEPTQGDWQQALKESDDRAAMVRDLAKRGEA